MGKRLFLLLLGGLIGIVMSPQTLIATDEIVAMQPDFDAVETIEPVKPAESLAEPAMPATQRNVKAAPVAYVSQPKNYIVTVYTQEMIAHGLSYTDIYKTGKLIYAHNSANLLGNLKNLSYGEVFYITEPSGTKAYQVMAMPTYNKTDDGYLEHDPYLMGKIKNTALGYDLALMTCAGLPVGNNGDATQRLVVFANEV